MKFILVWGFMVSVCLAAYKLDSNVVQCNVPSSKDEADSLSTTITKKRPELLPPFLVSCKDWDRDLAIAFALGLALGKHCDMPKSINTGANAECGMIQWKYSNTLRGTWKRVLL